MAASREIDLGFSFVFGVLIRNSRSVKPSHLVDQRLRCRADRTLRLRPGRRRASKSPGANRHGLSECWYMIAALEGDHKTACWIFGGQGAHTVRHAFKSFGGDLLIP